MHRDSLSQVARIELNHAEAHRVAASKHESYELAKRLGVPVAANALVNTAEELTRAVESMSLPMVLKPLSSFVSKDLLVRQEVQKAYSHESALRKGTAMLTNGPLQVQENFIGLGTGIEFLAINGDAVVRFQHLRVHEPMQGGGSSYRQSIPLHAGMLAAAKKLIEALKYDGVGMIEFKWNRETDQFVFIEINARFWGSLPLAIAAGADFPAFLYQYRVEGRTEFPNAFKVPYFARNWVNDIDWLRENARADRADPRISSLPWPVVARELLTVLKGRESADTFAWDDPRPFFNEFGVWFHSKVAVLKRKLSNRLRDSAPARTSAASKLRRCLRGASHVEFVCYGNICRSPYAEGVFKSQSAAQGVSATCSSSGFHAHTGRESPDTAIAVGAEMGIDLRAHRSALISVDAVQKANAILVFDWQNFDMLCERFPDARAKVFMLGVLTDSGSCVIADPYGQASTGFRTVYAQINQGVRRLQAILAER